MDTRHNLRRLRERANLTREQIAFRLGCSVSALEKWERTGQLPKNPRLRAKYLRLIGQEA